MCDSDSVFSLKSKIGSYVQNTVFSGSKRQNKLEESMIKVYKARMSLARVQGLMVESEETELDVVVLFCD